MRLLLIADTHVPKRARDLPPQVWDAVAASRGIDRAALDVLADRAPLLRDDAVTAGLVDRIGFRAVPLSARVRWGAPPDRVTPRTHTVIAVEIDGEAWLADVGFGGVIMSAPIRLNTDEPQRTPQSGNAA